MTIENATKNTTTSKYTEDSEGNLIEIINDDSKTTRDIESETNPTIYTKDLNPNIFNSLEYKKATENGEEGFLNSIFNYTIRKNETNNSNHNYTEYDFHTLELTKSDIKQTYIKTQTMESLVLGTTRYIDKTENFLGLLSNQDGKYKKGAKFKSKKSGGKVVKYGDLYNGQTGVGDLLENGAEVLFELMESSVNTQGLTDVMRYIMYLYSGKEVDYGVTDFKFGEYSIENMITVNSGSGWWWPIGSGNSTIQDTKNDMPVTTVITSGVGPRWGRNHGGIDISGNFSIPGPYIIASASGTVTYATQNGGIYDTGYYGSKDGGGYGNYVIIDHGNGFTTYYAHLYKGSITVDVGDRVEKGQVIGKMGSSGSSKGVHLHFEIRLNGVKLDPEEYVSFDNPRPEGIGKISEELYNFILAFEGGTSYYSPTDGKYIIFNNGLDNNLELTCGVAIGTKSSGVYDYVKKILNRDVNIGDAITKEEYNQIFEKVAESKMSIVDTAIAITGVTLTQNQKDAVYSLCWNASNASQTIRDALTKFKDNGEKGYWEYIHDYTNDGVAGLVRRRAEEFEMFVDGDYTVGSVDYGISKHREYNKKYDFPENEGE